MNDEMLFSTFAKGAKAKVVRGTNCVIYTRVSGKEQTENLSLTSQRKACHSHAEKCGYSILATFGGTHESASTDERKEFQAMLSFVKKSKAKVSYILVASLERFSRNDNSIWLSGQLRKLGIEIVSVTQPIDTSGPSGQMQQKLLFLYGEFDNQLRKQKCTTGIREMLLAGDWPTRPPLGYDSINVNGKRKIIINAKGKLLKQAFVWKTEGASYDAIRDKLAEKGIALCRQRVGNILHNPFYCGMISHNMLEGTIIKGNHEPLISKELFLKVNGLLDQHTHGYTIQEENEHIPLKRFLLCETCGRALRGYIVHKKNIHYYKCCTIGCKNNRNASVLNQRFAELLEVFKLDSGEEELITLVKQQAIATFNQFTKGNEDARQLLHEQYKELKKKTDRLEERFIDEELNAELYNKFAAKYADELKEIEEKLTKASNKVSNLEECVDLAVNFALNLPKKWLSADYVTKQRLQFLLFPEGISYDRKTDRCRTDRINSVFMYFAHLKQVILNEKRGIPALQLNYTSLSHWVAGARLELTTFGL